MSGLEPLAAIGLVCNVVQLAAYAINAIALLRQIKAEQSPDLSLQRHAHAVHTLSLKVVRGLKRTDDGNRALSDDEEHLLDVATECQQAARELEALLGEAPSARRGGLRAWRVVAWVVRKRGRLELLEERMERAQGLLHVTTVLDSINNVELEVNKLSAAHQTMVKRIREGRDDLMDVVFHESVQARQVTFEADLTRAQIAETANARRSVVNRLENGQALTSILVKRESQSTRNVVQQTEQRPASRVGELATQVRHDITSLAHIQERERLLDSLTFPEQDARKNQVGRHAAGAFDWLWEEHDGTISDPERAKWHGFTQWLEVGTVSRLFWITGKAGSGKSTLIKTILSHPSTLQTLRSWSKDDEAFVVSHFFWRPGAEMQKSYRGFLCSILQQLLRQNSHALSPVLGLLLNSDPTAPKSKRSPMDWPIEELERCCREALVCRGSHAVLLLIDAADEIDQDNGDFDDLADFVDEMSHIPTVKVCISSRPEPLFQDWLGGSPRLRVQDLTSNEMETFARVHLRIPSPSRQGHAASNRNSWQQQREIDRLCRQLCEKAEGVFLWLRFAIVNINRALRLGDGMADIEARVRQLPTGLYDLYKDMWERMNEGDRQLHQQKAALCFTAVVRAHEPAMSRLFTHARHSEVDILDVVFMAHPDLASRVLEADGPSKELVELIADECGGIESDIGKRCAGILEYQEFESDLWEWEKSVRSTTYYGVNNAKITLIHHSAYEFFTQTKEGAEILGRAAITDLQARLRLAGAYLAACRIAFWITRTPFELDHFFLWLEGLDARAYPVVLAGGERLLRIGETLYNEGVFEPRSMTRSFQKHPPTGRRHYLDLALQHDLDHFTIASFSARSVPSHVMVDLTIAASRSSVVFPYARPAPGNIIRWMLLSKDGGGIGPNELESWGGRECCSYFPAKLLPPMSPFVALLQGAMQGIPSVQSAMRNFKSWGPRLLCWARCLLYNLTACLDGGADLSAQVPLLLTLGPAQPLELMKFTWDPYSTSPPMTSRPDDFLVCYTAEASVLLREFIMPMIDAQLQLGGDGGGDTIMAAKEKADLQQCAGKVRNALRSYADRRNHGYVRRFFDAHPAIMRCFGRWSSRLVSHGDSVVLVEALVAMLRDGTPATTMLATELCLDVYLRSGPIARHVGQGSVWESVDIAEGDPTDCVSTWRWIVGAGDHSEQDAATVARIQGKYANALEAIRCSREMAGRLQRKSVAFESKQQLAICYPGGKDGRAESVASTVKMGGVVSQGDGHKGDDNGGDSDDDDDSDEDDDDDDDDDDGDDDDGNDGGDDDDGNDGGGDDDTDDDNDDEDEEDEDSDSDNGVNIIAKPSRAQEKAGESDADETSETVVQSDSDLEGRNLPDAALVPVGSAPNGDIPKETTDTGTGTVEKPFDPNEDLIDLLIDI